MTPRTSHQHTLGINRRELLQVGYSGLIGVGPPTAQRPMRNFRPWRQTDSGLRAERQPVVGNRAENVTLTRRIRLCRPHGRVEQSENFTRIANDARRLQLGAIQRS